MPDDMETYFPKIEEQEESDTAPLSSTQEPEDSHPPVSPETVGTRNKAAHARRPNAAIGFSAGVSAFRPGLILCFLIAFFGMLYIPLFRDTRDWYVMMTYHTSNPWLATAFLPHSTVEGILNSHKVVAPGGNTDPNQIKPAGPAPVSPSSASDSSGTNPPDSTSEPTPPEPVQLPAFGTSDVYPGTVIYENEGVQILKIHLKKTTARLIQVADPSRVFLGVTNQLEKRGQRLPDMCDSNDALCGINAGGFDDPGGRRSRRYPHRDRGPEFRIVYTDGGENPRRRGF